MVLGLWRTTAVVDLKLNCFGASYVGPVPSPKTKGCSMTPMINGYLCYWVSPTMKILHTCSSHKKHLSTGHWTLEIMWYCFLNVISPLSLLLLAMSKQASVITKKGFENLFFFKPNEKLKSLQYILLCLHFLSQKTLLKLLSHLNSATKKVGHFLNVATSHRSNQRSSPRGSLPRRSAPRPCPWPSHRLKRSEAEAESSGAFWTKMPDKKSFGKLELG